MVVDCAHGATYHIAHDVFHELGADVIAIGNEPDGFNINERCGAMHPESLHAAVAENGAHLGIALDGDGDRLVMVDAEGSIYDGDQLLYVICSPSPPARYACGRCRRHADDQPRLRACVWARWAFHSHGRRWATATCWRCCWNAGWVLGGENSGHIICLDKHTTGDGIVSALQVLRAIRESGKSLAALAAPVELYPQVLINVRVPERFDFHGAPAVKAALKAAESDLREGGRVLLRASGTEPLIRVMVEGRSRSQVQRWAESIALSVEQAAAEICNAKAPSL